MKKKIISVIVGVAGLTMAYFLASGISHIIIVRRTMRLPKLRAQRIALCRELRKQKVP